MTKTYRNQTLYNFEFKDDMILEDCIIYLKKAFTDDNYTNITVKNCIIYLAKGLFYDNRFFYLKNSNNLIFDYNYVYYNQKDIKLDYIMDWTRAQKHAEVSICNNTFDGDTKHIPNFPKLYFKLKQRQIKREAT